MDRDANAPLSRRQAAIFTAAAICLGLLVLAVGTELAMRAAGRRPSYLDAQMYVPLPDGRTYGLRPGYSGLYAGGQVHVGPSGLRGEAEEGGLLLLGDSALFGQGLDDDQTLAAQLSERLRAGGQAQPVVNAGVPGYNTPLELAQLRHLLPTLRPRRVVLIYVVDNDADLRPGVWVREDGTLDLHLSQSLASRGSRLLTRHLVLYAQLRGLFQSRQQRLAQEQRVPFAPDDPGWQRSKQAILEMRDLLGSRGIPFAVGGIGLVQNLEAMPIVQGFLAAQEVPFAVLWQTRDVAEFVRRHAISRTDSHAGKAATARMAAVLKDLVTR